MIVTKLLLWKPEYSVGVDEVDFEHQQMISLINAVYDEMGGRQDTDAIVHFLGDVHATISAHFALEETAMRKSGYAEYEAHKNDHEELLEQIRELMDSVDASPEAGIESLRTSLGSWFESHFSTFDARLHGKLNVPH